MTELEAVNLILASIGEAPISSFSSTEENEITDSALARTTLSEVERTIQAEGWHWNTDLDYPLTRTAEGKFTVPASVLRLEFGSYDDGDRRFVVRGGLIYDRLNNTDKLDLGDLRASKVVWRLDWDDIPSQAQQYCAIRASRIFSSRFLQSNTVFAYSLNDEQFARAAMVRDEELRERPNVLWGNDRRDPHATGFLPRTGRGLRYR